MSRGTVTGQRNSTMRPVIDVAQRQRDRIVTVLAEFFYFLGMRKCEPVFGSHEPEHPLPIQEANEIGRDSAKTPLI
jgi:hypothetical protein